MAAFGSHKPIALIEAWFATRAPATGQCWPTTWVCCTCRPNHLGLLHLPPLPAAASRWRIWRTGGEQTRGCGRALMSMRFAGRSGCGLRLRCTCGRQLGLHACWVERLTQSLQALSIEQIAPSSPPPQDGMEWKAGMMSQLAALTPSYRAWRPSLAATAGASTAASAGMIATGRSPC